jgi:ABC-type multidrug transport system ATPase subunit
MQEVEKVCSRVLFINLGRIQAEGTPRELALRVRAWRLTVTTVTPTGSERTVIVEMDRDDVGGYFNKLVKSGHAIKSMSIHEPTLEDFFVQSARGGGIDP